MSVSRAGGVAAGDDGGTKPAPLRDRPSPGTVTTVFLENRSKGDGLQLSPVFLKRDPDKLASDSVVIHDEHNGFGI